MPYFPEGIFIPDVNDPHTREWWQACKRHQLVVQRCKRCRAFRHSPLPICPDCNSFEYEWAPASGKGTIYTYTTVFHPTHPAVKAVLPYNVVVVELLDAGNVRMIGNLLDCPNEKIKVGMPVEVVWEDVSPEVTLPRWRPAKR